MPDNQIGPVFLIALGLLFGTHGLDHLVRAYRPTSLGGWVRAVLPAAGAMVIGALFVWSGFWWRISA